MPQNVHGTEGSIISRNDSFCDGNETAVYQHELTSQVASFTLKNRSRKSCIYRARKLGLA